MLLRVFVHEYQQTIEARDALEDQTPTQGNWKDSSRMLQRKVRTFLRYLKTINPAAYHELLPELEKINGKYEEAKIRFTETYEKNKSCPLEMENYEENIAFKNFLKWKYQLEAAEKICMDKNLL